MSIYRALLFFAVFTVVADSEVGNRVQCMTLSNGQAMCWVVSEDVDTPNPGDLGDIVMTRQNCESLRSLMLSYLDQIKAQADAATNQLYYAYDDVDRVDDLLIQAQTTISQAQAQASPHNDPTLDISLQNAATQVINAQAFIVGVKGCLDSSVSSVEDILTSSSSARNAIEAVSCQDATCTPGEGSQVSCPCQEEFNGIISRLDGKTPSLVLSLFTNAVAMASRVNNIYVGVTNISHNVEQILSRLNAPDDRMWTELDKLWGELTNSWGNTSIIYNQIATRSIDIEQFLYNLRHVISGHDGSGGVPLTTEGVIALYGAVGSMFNWVTQSEQLSHFDQQFGAFSNTVYQLFKEFNQTMYYGLNNNNNLINALASNSDRLYQAATNFNLAARARYSQLSIASTNWFSRVEFYLQSLLGWYEDRNPDSLLSENQPKQKSSVESMIDDSTNNVNSVDGHFMYATNLIRGVINPVKDSLTQVRFSASLPSRVVLFPDVEILNYNMEFYIDTQRIAEYCNKARDISTLIWVVGFWLCCIVGVGLLIKIFVKGALWLIKYVSEGQ